jgi:hypothetical protein
MKWNKTDLEQFFGCPPSLALNQETLFFFDYTSKRLRYLLVVDEKGQQVSISADPERPFGADSLYEFYVPCDTIELFSDPYHAEFKAIGFWYGGGTALGNRRLTIMKRPDGDLKVWPELPPGSHRSRRTELGAPPNVGPATSFGGSGVSEGPPSVS